MAFSGDYADATLTNPGSALTDFSLIIDLANLPSAWWDTVTSSDGTKGRAVKGDGATEIPADWINFSSTGSGLVRVNWSGTLSASGEQKVRIYPPLSGNSSYENSATYGAWNAYDGSWEAYWPEGGGTDRTSNQASCAAGGSGPTIGSVTGNLGHATSYDGSDDYCETTLATITGLPDSYDMSVFAWINADGVSDNDTAWGWGEAGSGDLLIYYPNDNNSGSGGSRLYWMDLTGNIVDESGSDISGTWYFHSFVTDASNDHEVQRNGSLVANSNATGSPSGFDSFDIGGYNQGSQPGAMDVQEVQIHSTARSDDWIDEEYAQTDDNASFWGTWTFSGGGGEMGIMMKHFRMLRG
jgi:hypothetical protein